MGALHRLQDSSTDDEIVSARASNPTLFFAQAQPFQLQFIMDSNKQLINASIDTIDWYDDRVGTDADLWYEGL